MNGMSLFLLMSLHLISEQAIGFVRGPDLELVSSVRSFSIVVTGETQFHSDFAIIIVRKLKLTYHRYSILPALSLEDGIFHMNIVQGSFNMETFHVFISQLLQRMSPYDGETHPSKSVIVLDNCQIHKNVETLQMILDWLVHVIAPLRT